MLPAGQYVFHQSSLILPASYASHPSPSGITWVPDQVVDVYAGMTTYEKADLTAGAWGERFYLL
jgi:hypothetical protein